MKRFLITYFGILTLLNLEIEIPFLFIQSSGYTIMVISFVMLGTVLSLFILSIILGLKKKISKFWILDVFLVIVYLVLTSVLFVK